MTRQLLVYATAVFAWFFLLGSTAEDIILTTAQSDVLRCTSSDQCYITSDCDNIQPVTVDCGQAALCFVDCGQSATTGQQCMPSIIVDATQSANLTVVSSQEACLANATFFAPDWGIAQFSIYEGSVASNDIHGQLKDITVYAGSSTQSIEIDCSSGNDDGCASLTVHAETADFLRISLGALGSLGTPSDNKAELTNIYCPRGNAYEYNTSTSAPCVIAIDPFSEGIRATIHTVEGWPEDLVFDGPAIAGRGVTVRLTCEINGRDSTPAISNVARVDGLFVVPDEDPCNNYTPSPTNSPTDSPTNAPTYSPTLSPTNTPSYSPSNAPTQPPTSAPTNTPSQTPTAAPTHSPTRAPSGSPSQAPTAAPTFSPSYAPTKAPTQPPTAAPTFSPSYSPTNAPTQPPTAAPSHSPTYSPSAAPTFSPSADPTFSPTNAPSFSPTHAPTFSPSAAPTQAPTNVQSDIQVELFMYYNMSEQFRNIILSEFNRKLSFAVQLGLKYAIYENDYDAYKFLYGNYVCVSFSLVSYDENAEYWDDRYDCVTYIGGIKTSYREELGKPDSQKDHKYKPALKAAEYVAVMKMVLTGDDVDDSVQKVDLLQDQLNNAGQIAGNDTSTNSTGNTDENADNIADFSEQGRRRRRRLSGVAGSFKNILEQCMMTSPLLQETLEQYPHFENSDGEGSDGEDSVQLETCEGYIGLDLERFTLVALQAQELQVRAPPPPRSLVADTLVEILRITIYVFIGCCLLTAVIAKVHAIRIKADNVKPWNIFWFSLYTWDFYSDLLFCLRLLKYCVNKERQYEVVWWIYGASNFFVLLPWLLNLKQLFTAQKKWTTDASVQEGVRGWFMDWSIILVVAVALTGSSFGAIELANSNLFGHDLFSMGLSKKHIKAFQGKRFYSSVLFENGPQLAAQIYFLVLLGGFDEATVTALLSSGVSILLSVVDIWSARHLVTVMKKQAAIGKDVISIQFKIDTCAQAFDEIEIYKRSYLGQPKALSKAIAETLVVHRRNVEIYQLIASNLGIKVGFTVYIVDDRGLDAILECMRTELKKLQLLIAVHWKMTTYPAVTKIAEGATKGPTTRPLNDLSSVVRIDGEVYSTRGRFRAMSASSTYSAKAERSLVPIEELTDDIVSSIKDRDPQCSTHKLTVQSQSQSVHFEPPMKRAHSADTFDMSYQAMGVELSSAAAVPQRRALERVDSCSGNSMMSGTEYEHEPEPERERVDSHSEMKRPELASMETTLKPCAQIQNVSNVCLATEQWRKYVANMTKLIAFNSKQMNEKHADYTSDIEEEDEEAKENLEDEEMNGGKMDVGQQWLLSLENMNMLLETREKLKAITASQADTKSEKNNSSDHDDDYKLVHNVDDVEKLSSMAEFNHNRLMKYVQMHGGETDNEKQYEE